MNEDEIRREVNDRARRRVLPDGSQVEQKLIEALCRLPEDVRNFAVERCFFAVLGGPNAHGFFVLHASLSAGAGEPRELVVLNSSRAAEDEDEAFQSIVAHEIAHLWLGHPEMGSPDFVANEDEAAKLVREWGFTGIGALGFDERP
jgi:hypothetical protein